MSFQEELEKSVLEADEKLDKEELLTDIFKSFVAKMFEHLLTRGKKGMTQLRMDEVVAVKQNLINEFRQASLGEYQKPTVWYEDLFEKTVGEIYSGAQHEGSENIELANQNLEINEDAYKREGHLFVPNSSVGS